MRQARSSYRAPLALALLSVLSPLACLLAGCTTPAGESSPRSEDPAELAVELDLLAAEDPADALWRIRCAHLLAEQRGEAARLLRGVAEHSGNELVRSAAERRARGLEDGSGFWPLEGDAFEEELERLLESSGSTDSFVSGGLELRLVFHGDIQLSGEERLPWSAQLREPYVRAAERWLRSVRGVRGRERHTLSLHLFSLPFAFGNGFATPLHESLEEIEGNWLPHEGMVGINSFLYEEGARDDPELVREIYDNAMHEIGHVLGIGGLWNLARYGDEVDVFAPWEAEMPEPDQVLRELVHDDPRSGGLVYRGPSGVAAFARVHGPGWEFVPVSSDGGHLYARFDEEPERRMPDGRLVPATEHELMSHRDVLSEISLGILADLGWEVDLSAVDPWPAPDDPLEPWFPLSREVFGVRVLARAGTDPGKLAHATAVLGEYLDNDEDGQVDCVEVLKSLHEREATLLMFPTPEEAEDIFEELPWEELEGRALQDLYASETHPGGAAEGRFDASLEEVLHLVTSAGYAGAFPDVFGEAPGSRLAQLMDAARGGHFTHVPASYPDGAWYTYDDRTCEYECMVTEYVYWGLTSLLGAQDFPGRAREIASEWRLARPADLRDGDPGLRALLEDPRWRLPRVLPDGVYAPPSAP